MIRGMASRIFPHFAHGEVVKGFGRGSKQLGIPTAAGIVTRQGIVNPMSDAKTLTHNNNMPTYAHLPAFIQGPIARGHQRGGSELDMPTANYADSVVDNLPKEFECGIYFGWASVDDGPIHKMVMSVGWNPYYKNEKKTMETHILHTFPSDFYGANLKVCVAGYLRAEKNFTSLDALIDAIKEDIRQANELLDKPQYKVYKEDNFFIKSTNHRL